MTILNCSATTCVYNKNQLCSRGNIEVTGCEARHSDETNCGSFEERKSSSAQNSAAEDGGYEKIQIKCDAESCTYNDSYKCTASAINISGSNACNCHETECSTFHCGCGCR